MKVKFIEKMGEATRRGIVVRGQGMGKMQCASSRDPLTERHERKMNASCWWQKNATYLSRMLSACNHKGPLFLLFLVFLLLDNIFFDFVHICTDMKGLHLFTSRRVPEGNPLHSIRIFPLESSRELGNLRERMVFLMERQRIWR